MSFEYGYRYFSNTNGLTYTTNSIQVFPGGVDIRPGSEVLIEKGQNELWVTGNSQIDGDLTINGPVSFTGTVSFEGTLDYNMITITTDYTISSEDRYVVVDTASSTGPVTVNIPVATSKRELTIIDGGGQAGQKNIIVAPPVSNTILGQDSVTINDDYTSITVISNIDSQVWHLV